MIEVVHFSDLHFGSGERYGSVNPETGLNKRFEDFILALEKPVDYAIQNKVDLVIFTGDTYKHAVPEPIYQKEFAKKIKQLSVNNIPTILLVGNHDVLYRVDGSNALEIFQTLDVNHVTVMSKIELKKIRTKSGDVQIISLPHITKSRLLTKDEYRNLSVKEQDNLMLEKARQAICSCVEKLDPESVTILIGHGTVETAKFGSEQDLSIGKVLSYPLSYFQSPVLDYVGFGHIHRHQIIQNENPLILYAGSLERVDFGEEGEEKGFVCLELQKGKQIKYKFISTKPREFLTIFCDLTEANDPQKQLESTIKLNNLQGAIVRLRFKIHEEDMDKINQKRIRELLDESFSYIIQPEIIKKERTYRIAELDTCLVSNPIKALEKYLFDFKEEEKSVLLEKARELLNNIREIKN